MSKIAFAVLAGGRSSRFRSDKRTARFGGKPMLGVMMDKASELGWPLILSFKSERQLDALRGVEGIHSKGVTTVTDPTGVDGPLAGVLAVLSAVRGGRVFVTSTDLPLLETRTIKRLFETAACAAADVCVPRTPRGLEPLAAVYSRGCLTDLATFADKGGRSLEKFLFSLPASRVRLVAFSAEEAVQFANINTPKDLAFFSASPPHPVPLLCKERELPRPEGGRAGVRVSGHHAG